MSISRRSGMLPALALVLGLAPLGACTTNPATGQQAFTAFMSEDDELRVGAEEHPKILEQMGGAYEDKALSAYINAIGQQMAGLSEKPNLKFTFTVLNDPQVNAFALPGGYIYVTRGLLALAEDEAEMAGVVAHEIGHVTGRHTAQRYSQAMATNIGLTAASILAGIAGVAIPQGVGQAVSFGAQAILQGYSREQELEADKLGVRYMTRAGYDPKSLISFFGKMSAHTQLAANLDGRERPIEHDIMSSHPRTAERIQQAIQLSGAVKSPGAKRARKIYLDQISGMVFGDDTDEGFVRGRAFIHPGLKFRFEVPDGFILRNSPTRVVAKGPEDSVILFTAEAKEKAMQVRSIPRYLANDWARQLSLRDVEGFQINGLSAATGWARVNTDDGERDLRLLAVRASPERIYRFTFVTRPGMTNKLNEPFRRTTYSFRNISDKEARAIHPHRIALRTVKAGDTADKLADAMPLGKFNRQWFRVLNGLGPKEDVTPGRRVKVIIE